MNNSNVLMLEGWTPMFLIGLASGLIFSLFFIWVGSFLGYVTKNKARA
ncbi:hypothetical protein [Cytobacillus horneckiae]